MDDLKFWALRTEQAQEIVVAEKMPIGHPLAASILNQDYSARPICAHCNLFIKPPRKALQCSGCRAIIYCGKECAKKRWKLNHSKHCAPNKRQMARIPMFRSIAESFPWGRIEKDGSLNLEIALGRFNVLGSACGFWSTPGGTSLHQFDGDLDMERLGGKVEPWFQESTIDFFNGKGLLESQIPGDEDGWKLPRDLIPYRNFSDRPYQRPPVIVTVFKGGVVDWDSWYKWRKLSKASPAALIMHFPLSVYQMLVHCLEVTSPTAGTESARKRLVVNLLGVEKELNFIPLFSELALLLPYHDIVLVMFGPAITQVLDKAHGNMSSLAAKTFTLRPVFEYCSPEECGHSSISIFLSDIPYWNKQDVPGFRTVDAIVVCNAGILCYSQWNDVILTSVKEGVPFAVTEYQEMNTECQREHVAQCYKDPLALTCELMPIEVNPFHRPGRNGNPSCFKTPNHSNGFTLVINSNKLFLEWTRKMGYSQETTDNLEAEMHSSMEKLEIK
ncbi:hypothetical protein Moror_7136 [Moniliophthora roreri MCA 2997]|uniref:MYND-type domain-containing protein n=2 Tax=Moniliophthora roreri TaxID=221103 RepID=V2XUX0_MONRO|nr:hypothetical protein Moror_7136 [Moniliophthora roreri MCA 2997]KAI3602865.1 hypothetical protein WG66_011175 [Moniliophthora roreri]